MSRDDLIVSLEDIVRHQARLLAGRREELRDDLVGEGWVGACLAVDSYRPDSGASLRTYASIRIRGAQLDWLRRNSHTVSGLGRSKVPADDVRRQSPAEVPDTLTATDDPARTACDHVETVRALAALPRRTQEVLLERFVLETPLEVLGARYGVSGSRICQLVRRAVA